MAVYFFFHVSSNSFGNSAAYPFCLFFLGFFCPVLMSHEEETGYSKASEGKDAMPTHALPSESFETPGEAQEQLGPESLDWLDTASQNLAGTSLFHLTILVTSSTFSLSVSSVFPDIGPGWVGVCVIDLEPKRKTCFSFTIRSILHFSTVFCSFSCYSPPIYGPFAGPKSPDVSTSINPYEGANTKKEGRVRKGSR